MFSPTLLSLFIIFTLLLLSLLFLLLFVITVNREVKHDVYGKRQTAKMKLLQSVFSFLYSRIKTFVFAVNTKRPFFSFYDLFKDYKKRTENQR